MSSHKRDGRGCRITETTEATDVPAILIVDDDPDFLKWAAEAVAKKQLARVLKATSAQAALEIVQQTPDLVLVISDHYMEPHDGTDLLAAVKKLRPEVRRVIMTGRPRMEVFIGAINRAGVHKYIPKLASPQLLVKGVLKQLDAAVARPNSPAPGGSTPTRLCA